MNQEDRSPRSGIILPRRTALATLGVAATVGLLGLVQRGGLVYALTREERDKITPDEIIARGKKGNERFLSGKRKTGLLDKIRPAIEATQYDGDRTAKNYPFVNAVARKNVELTMAGIRAGSSVLKGLEDKGGIKIAGAMYSIETGAVEFFS
ncbi:MAG: hypothetical protein E8D40_15660 [Nitrospira sp.]|nr:MAG: hypothetical protein E8D40_15660 [Nitrospira sp.]